MGNANNTYSTKKAGESIGEICKKLGIHINLAPVVDVNNNPKNPVINDRSFGSTPDIVIKHAEAFIQGLQNTGTIACIKHFPGHGDTHVDSHDGLPIIDHPRTRFDAIELAPFKALIDEGVEVIMMSHIATPQLNLQNPNQPASLSKNMIQNILREQLGFKGLVITDALDMKGALDSTTENVSLLALMAGNDMLLCPTDVSAAIHAIVNAVKEGVITEKEIDEHVERIFALKNKLFYTKK
jgi:beta-glucosidase-like glycosyl hydrolase